MLQKGLKFLLSCLTRQFAALKLYFGESKEILAEKNTKKKSRENLKKKISIETKVASHYLLY